MAAIKIKLVVDRSRKRVLLADAGSDFVDVILSFLTLPLSAVQLAAAGASPPGCLANLCGSVDRLRDAQLLKVGACHGTLHRPTHKDEFGCTRFGCSACTPFVEKHVTPNRYSQSYRCWEVAMARLVHAYNQTPRKELFCNWKERFVISDDWVIKQASTINVVSFLRGLDADGICRDGYEEVDVDVGWAELISLLKTCISSTTIFTNVFLAKEKDPVRLALAKRSVLPELLLTTRKLRHQETNDPTGFESHPQVFIKLFFDRKNSKVLYAECKHEFVDLLLGFLTYPMGCILKNLAGTSHLCFNNLYSSAADLDAAGFLMGPCFGDMRALLDPSLALFKIGCCSCGNNKRACHSCDSGFARDHTYVVDDDLRIYQASAASLLKHWYKRDLVDMDIAISKQEAVALLRAVVNSKTALTDAFKGRFMQEAPRLPPLERRMGAPSMEKMQIFVRIFVGETITLDVASTDTVAAVRSKIHAKKKLAGSCGLVYASTVANACRIHGPWLIVAFTGRPRSMLSFSTVVAS